MLAQGKDIDRNTSLLFSREELKSFQQFMEREFQFHLDWYNYESAERRLTKALNKLNLNSLSSLEWKLRNGEITFQNFINEFTVNVTELFREPDGLHELKVSVLPFFRKAQKIKVLLVGSSTGQELATICILLKENNLLDRSEILATDINSKVLKQAKHPKISKSKLASANKNYLQSGGYRDLEHYFIGAGGDIYLEADLLRNVSTRVFDLCQSNLETEFDLIICRNTLIYFQYSQQHNLINNLGRHLKPHGFLALGEKESIIRIQNLDFSLAIVSSDHNLNRKINA